LLDRTILDVAQDFVEPVKRFNIIDLAYTQHGVHYSWAPDASIQTRENVTFYVPALSIA